MAFAVPVSKISCDLAIDLAGIARVLATMALLPSTCLSTQSLPLVHCPLWKNLHIGVEDEVDEDLAFGADFDLLFAFALACGGMTWEYLQLSPKVHSPLAYEKQYVASVFGFAGAGAAFTAELRSSSSATPDLCRLNTSMRAAS
jgi:hypothetical protein